MLFSRALSRAKPGSFVLSALFIGALVVGVGFNAVSASGSGPGGYYGYYAPTTPSAATSVSAAPGNGSAILRWRAPLNNGGVPITGYVITALRGFFKFAPQTFNTPATTDTITGLTNGTTYTFKIAAINPLGTGPVSLASNPVTVGTPMVPTVTSGSSGNAHITLRWVAPATNNGAAVTGYTVVPFLKGIGQRPRVFANPLTTRPITGLLNGKAYTFRVAARNANGLGLLSAPSAAIVVGLPAAPIGTHPVRILGGQFKVNFSPGSNNGAPIRKYTATCKSPNGVTRAVIGLASPILVTGLSRGKAYTCVVKATNSRGTGPSSLPSPPLVA